MLKRLFDSVVLHRNTPPEKDPENDEDRPSDYSELTEQPGAGATAEQLERLYHRYHFARELAAGKRVLEVACGAGLGLGYLQGKAAAVVGVDYTGNLLQVAQSHYGDRVPLIQLDAHDLPFADQSFDLIFIYEAIYYLQDQAKFACEARRLLADGGLLLIGTVNRDWDEFGPSPFSTYYPTAPELAALLEGAGFQDITLYAAFSTEVHGWKHHLVGLVRRLVVALDLMPKTLEGRARFKRLVYGNLQPMPAEITDGLTELEPSVRLETTQSTGAYKILYAIGRAPQRA